VFALQPDLIIGWAHNFSSQELGEAQTWQARGIGAYIVPATLPGCSLTLEDAVYPFLRDLGQMFGVEQRAEAYIASCRRQEERAMSQVADLPVATAVVLQDHGRSTYSLYDASYLIDDVLAKAGFANLVRRKTSMVGPERILAYDPEYLVYVSLPGKDGNDLSEEDALGLVNANPDLKRLRAVQQGHIIVIPFAEVNSGNGRAIDALNRLVTGRIRNR
ncbi:MAG: ABC transporter substrate-binding protein, partial [Selenomonas sp.]|nr:ABC transporter substrate-binding protein [Selenomonas sp.]